MNSMNAALSLESMMYLSLIYALSVILAHNRSMRRPPDFSKDDGENNSSGDEIESAMLSTP